MVRIIGTKKVLGGRKRISGTRISIDIVWNYVRDGSIDQISLDYPHLTKSEIQEALEYLDKQVHDARGKFGTASPAF